MQNLKPTLNHITRYLKRKVRVNAKIKSQSPDFRIIVEKTNLYIKAQVVDATGNVVASIWDKGLKGKTKTERAQLAGQNLAELMKKKAIEKATFDRNGHLYHGRVKALADGIRTGGIAI